MRPAALHGRDDEVRRCAAVVLALPRPGSLHLVGGPGIGKTSLLAAAAGIAMDAGVTTLSAAPAERDCDLPFSGLVDLLDPVVDQVLPGLATPQREALEVALLRRTARSSGYERLAIGMAVRTAVLSLARRGSVLLLVDDVQWLDPGSREAVVWATRRLGQAPVALLSSSREPVPDLVADEDAVLRVEPLGADAVREVVRSSGVVLSAAHVDLVVAAARGNPLAALALARGSQGADLLGPALAVPESVGAAVRARLDSLPRSTVLLLGRAAAAGRDTGATLSPADLASFDAPADVARVVGSSVRFAHPLFASLAYGSLSEVERTAAHRYLADRADDMLDRARQLALATTAADPLVADELAAAAAEAERRGATAAAGALWQRSAEFTPARLGDLAMGRLLDAGRSLARAGEYPRAKVLLEEVLDALPPGPRRASGLLVLIDVLGQETNRQLELAEQAVREAESGELAQEAAAVLGDLNAIAGRPRDALRIYAGLVDSPVPTVRAVARSMTGNVSRALGSYDAGLVERWAAEEDLDGRLLYSCRLSAAYMALWLDDVTPMQRLCEPAVRSAQAAGDDDLAAQYSGYLAEAAERMGDRRAARRHAEHAHLAQIGESRPAAFVRSLVDADTDACASASDLAATGLKTSTSEGDLMLATKSAAVLQRALLASGRFDVAIGSLLQERTAAMEVRHPAAYLRWHSDAVEMALAAGDLTRAAAVSDLLTELSDEDAMHSPNDDAAALRCRALMALRAGRLPESEVLLTDALELHARRPVPKERARTLLWLGITQRRLRHRAQARRTLAESAVLFGAIDAGPWRRRAEGELRRVGGAPGDGVAGSGNGQGLTATEARIAELVSIGQTNREVAAATSLSLKTVEANLSRVYRKLGVRSRSELVRRSFEVSVGPRPTRQDEHPAL